MAWTAIVGIVGIAASLVGPWLGARWAFRQQDARQRYERELHDLDELRAVLDDASVALTLAETNVLSELADALASVEVGRTATLLPGSGDPAIPYDSLHEAARAYDRLRVRLGAEHPVCDRFSQAMSVLVGLAGLLGKALPADWERQHAERSAVYRDARLQLAQEAQRLVGSQLPVGSA